MIQYGIGSKNTYTNLEEGLLGIQQILKSNGFIKSFNIENGDIVIKYRHGEFSFEIFTCNAPNTSFIIINQYRLKNEHGDKEYICSEEHNFEPRRFSQFVNKYLLTPADLEEQQIFKKQEQEREDALKNAHESNPKTCDNFTCVFCRNEESIRNENAQARNDAENHRKYGPNWRNVLGLGLGYT